ncbi:putative chitinase [Luteibacter sp. UNC138MFCol5.1]|uniref:glycoside hydrolase family 19 protein n=1 Tax=Luteibacter sp. UNC138MFCol5.1 TaxID=1502774 RepID=UPI0008CEB79D|nr:glycoside hydrolase family 19 protein [Luteibacter sp. UNC138MFCol5.1]SEO63717.1 putative chitinase [Luteibacter sp. UNC138MFCol5.1]
MDAKTLQAATGISGPRANEWAAPITAAMAEFDVVTPAQQAAFVAEWAHETAGFALLREVWGPNAAQRRYEGRADLGNTQPGDGKRFMGRGLPQLTGRANYTKASAALGVDLVRNPQLLEQPLLAARAAGWFWKANGLNRYADRGDFLGLSIRINGKNKDGLPNGWEDRQRRWAIAKRALGVQ